MNKNILLFLIQIYVIFTSHFSLAQTKNQAKVQDQIISADDAFLTIKKIGYVSAIDNVSGIYSAPISTEIQTMLEKDHRWEITTFEKLDENTRRKIETDSSIVKKLFSDSGADALIQLRIQKGPRGIEITSTLILKSDLSPFVTETSPVTTEFETSKVLKIAKQTVQKMIDRIPYTGIIMSRNGQRVTINSGTIHGSDSSKTFSVIKLLKINRHPKSGILLSTDKEIIGKIKVFKSDEAMSFGEIQFEKSVGMIQPGDKVLLDSIVTYPSSDPIENRKDKDLAFGERAAEWLPQDPPQFGKFNASLALGQYSQSASLATAGAVDGSSSLVPGLSLGGEFWLTKEWQAYANLRQSSFSVTNGLSGSSPSKVNMTTTKTSLGGGYSFFFSEEYYGPKIQLLVGLSSFVSSPDATTPLAYTNMNFSGLSLGGVFSTPLGDHSPFIIGGKLNYYLFPTLSENTASGASSTVSIGDFSVFVTKTVRQNFNYNFELDLEQYGASFSGAGARTDSATNISQASSTFIFGVEYLF